MERDLDLARIGDDVIVSENTPFFVDDKAGALAFLRYQPVEEVVGHDARGDVHDRRDVFAVDADVVLLFGVKRFAAGGFGNLNALRMAEPVGGMEASAAVGSEAKKGRHQNRGENKSAEESHRNESLKTCTLILAKKSHLPQSTRNGRRNF